MQDGNKPTSVANWTVCAKVSTVASLMREDAHLEA